MYHLECHTCDDEETFPDRQSAQTAFNDHAEQLHDVVLRRVDDPSPAPQQPESADDATEDDTTSEGGDSVTDQLHDDKRYL